MIVLYLLIVLNAAAALTAFGGIVLAIRYTMFRMPRKRRTSLIVAASGLFVVTAITWVTRIR